MKQNLQKEEPKVREEEGVGELDMEMEEDFKRKIEADQEDMMYGEESH